MFRINEGTHTARFLGIGNHVQHHCSFPGGFRSVNFNNPPLGHTTDAQGQIQRERPGGNALDAGLRIRIAQPHDASFTKSFGDLRERAIEIGLAGIFAPSGFLSFLFCHDIMSPVLEARGIGMMRPCDASRKSMLFFLVSVKSVVVAPRPAYLRGHVFTRSYFLDQTRCA